MRGAGDVSPPFGRRGPPPTRGAGAGRPARVWPWALAALLLALLSLAARWPGVAMYDTVSQYDQALSGDYTDWHPPVMARAWALLVPLWPGTAPLLLLQMLGWWGGLGLLAAALARGGRPGGGVAALAVGAVPLWLGWATAILKDAQLAAALVAVTGLVAWWRLAGRRVPAWGAGLAALLLAYATLVRGNAVFGAVPFALALVGWGGVRRWWVRGAALLGAVGLVIAASGPINHRLMGAEATGVERSLPLYDLAGTAHFARLPTIPGVAPAAWGRGERLGCYTPFFWNPYGEPALCDAIGQAAMFGDLAPPHPMRAWAAMVAAHPLAYLRHRLGHLNSNLRLWVGPGEGDAVPHLGSEPNDLGLGNRPNAGGRLMVWTAGWLAATPFGWPGVWLALALALLWAARGHAPAVGLARALALSAACLSGSYAVVSIASDLRYHLWSMVAAALAAVLLAGRGALHPRRARIGGAAVALVALVAMAGHLGLAPSVPMPLPPHGPPPPAGR